MARNYAVTPKGILNGLKRIAPDVEVETLWEPDYSERWDGDGPDPAEEGMVAHTVEVKVTVTDEDGETIVTGNNYLGGVWVHPDEPDPDVHGYFPQMLEEALGEAADEFERKPAYRERGRKDWDPRPSWEPYIEQLRAAEKFMKRSLEEIYKRNMEYHRRREARERAKQARKGKKKLAGRKDWDPRPRKSPESVGAEWRRRLWRGRGPTDIELAREGFTDGVWDRALSTPNPATGTSFYEEAGEDDSVSQIFEPEIFEKVEREANEFFDRFHRVFGASDFQAGKEFWMARQGDPNAFSDTWFGTPDERRQQREAARRLGPLTLYRGHDGRVHATQITEPEGLSGRKDWDPHGSAPDHPVVPVIAHERSLEFQAPVGRAHTIQEARSMVQQAGYRVMKEDEGGQHELTPQEALLNLLDEDAWTVTVWPAPEGLSGRKDWDPRFPDPQLKEFLDGYLDAAMRKLAQREPLRDHNVNDIAPDTMRQIEETAIEFLAENKGDLQGYDLRTAGRQFYFTRNDEGERYRYWDWPTPEAAKRLRESAIEQGWHQLYFDVDGLIRAEYN